MDLRLSERKADGTIEKRKISDAGWQVDIHLAH